MSQNLAIQKIAPLIHEIRRERVILDADLARIYGVSVKALNQAIKRNAERFPEDFVFRLTRSEFEDSLRSQFVTSYSKSQNATLKSPTGSNLRSQIVTSKGRGGRRYLPHAFTEHGAIMAANVLNSKQAVQMSVFVVRAFVKLRELLATNKQLADKLNELEGKVGTHDKAIVSIIAAIRGLTEPAKRNAPVIGFRSKRDPQTDTEPKQFARRARKK
jgi:hypothetical protein